MELVCVRILNARFKIGGTCDPLTWGHPHYLYSAAQQFHIPSREEATTYSCGLIPEVVISNQTPIKSLSQGESFTAGDFPVIIKEVQQIGDRFTGLGAITVPYLNMIGINVRFSNIKINTSRQLFEGVVETTYDPDWKNIVDLNKVVEFFTGDNGKIEEFNADDIDIASVEIQTKTGEVVSVAVSDQGPRDDSQDSDNTTDTNTDIATPTDISNDTPSYKVVLKDHEGNSTIIDTNIPVVITDKHDEQFQIDEHGKVTHLGTMADGGKPTSENTAGINRKGEVESITAQTRVVFKASGQYTSDVKDPSITDTKYTDAYESLSIEGESTKYDVLYKAVSNTLGDDTLEAEVSFAEGVSKKDLIFKTLEGTAVKVKDWEGNTAILELKNQFDYGHTEVIAVVEEDTSQDAGATNHDSDAPLYKLAGKVN